MADTINIKPSFEELLNRYDTNTEPAQKSFSGLVDFIIQQWDISRPEAAEILSIPYDTLEAYSSNKNLRPEPKTLNKISNAQNLPKNSLNILRRVSLGDGNDINVLTEQTINKLKKATDEHDKNRIIITYFRDCLGAEGFTQNSFSETYGTNRTNIGKLLQYNLDNLKGSLSQISPETAKKLASCLTTNDELAEKMAKVFLKEIEPKKTVNILLSEARNKMKGATSDIEKKQIVAEFFDKAIIAQGHNGSSFGKANGYAHNQISRWRNPNSELSLYNTDWKTAKRIANALAEGEQGNKDIVTDIVLLIKGIAEKTQAFSELMEQVQKGDKSLSNAIIQFRTQEMMPQADFATRFGIAYKTLRKIEKNERIELNIRNKFLDNINEYDQEKRKIKLLPKEIQTNNFAELPSIAPKGEEEYIYLLGEKTKLLNTIQIEYLVGDIKSLAKNTGFACEDICHILKDKDLQSGIIELKKQSMILGVLTQQYAPSELAEKLSKHPTSELGGAVNELYTQYLEEKNIGTVIKSGSNTRIASPVRTIDNNYMEL